MIKLLCVLLLATTLLVACGAQDVPEDTPETHPPQPPSPTPSGARIFLEEHFDSFGIDGSTSMIPLHQSLRDEFSTNREEVWHSRTVDAFMQFVRGDIDVLLSVSYSDELIEHAVDSGVDLISRPITREAFVFLINVNNPVQSLTQDQVRDIYSGAITNWNQVGGNDVPITAFQRNRDSGSQIRMEKFMGDTPLIERDVELVQGMGDIVERMASYDEGKYSIAFSMYTFIEKQYINPEVTLLAIDGVAPNDDTVFDGTYPIVVYNYLYHDANNAEESEFADYLYEFLLSDEGQQLISDSGYVNLNVQLNRNTDVFGEHYAWGDNYSVFDFYNEETGQFYDVVWDENRDATLLIFDNFADFVLRDSEYRDNATVWELLMFIYNSDFPLNPNTARLHSGLNDDVITIDQWVDGDLSAGDFFNFRHNGKYFSRLRYYIDRDKFVLEAVGFGHFDDYLESGFFYRFDAYTENFTPGLTIELTRAEFENIYVRPPGWRFPTEGDVNLNFFQPFK